jgi:phosphatidylserine synthase
VTSAPPESEAAEAPHPESKLSSIAAARPSTKLKALSTEVFAVCCAHPLSAFDGQKTNLQPEKYFCGVHATAKNVILLYFAVTGETLRGFVDSL